jgi:hypothetical protein
VDSGHFKAAIARMPGLLAGAPEIIHADLAADGGPAWRNCSPPASDGIPGSGNVTSNPGKDVDHD